MWNPLPPVINRSRLCHNIWFEEKTKPCIYCQTSRTYLHQDASSPHWTSSLRLKVVRAEGEKMATHCSVKLMASLIPAGLSSAVFTMRMRPLGLGWSESRSEDESMSLIMVHMVKGGSLQHATLTSFYLQLSGEHLCLTANERVRGRGRRNVGERQMMKKMKNKGLCHSSKRTLVRVHLVVYLSYGKMRLKMVIMFCIMVTLF